MGGDPMGSIWTGPHSELRKQSQESTESGPAAVVRTLAGQHAVLSGSLERQSVAASDWQYLPRSCFVDLADTVYQRSRNEFSMLGRP